MLSLTLVTCLHGGPFEPPAGQEGSDAIPLDDARIVGWATAIESYQPDDSVSDAWRDSLRVLGPAEGTAFNVCSLGPSGTLTVSFGRAISNRLGPELAIFENSFSDSFLELSFVEVSSDGVNFVRFPNRSLTPSPVGSFGLIDATEVTGLAGNFRAGFGTPFDFSDLPEDALLDVNAVRFVRLVDVEGGLASDSSGATIYDPFPTSISAGFDCDAIALLAPREVGITDSTLSQGTFQLSLNSEVGLRYAVEASETLLAESWTQVSEATADSDELAFTFSTDGVAKRFFRVVSE